MVAKAVSPQLPTRVMLGSYNLMICIAAVRHC